MRRGGTSAFQKTNEVVLPAGELERRRRQAGELLTVAQPIMERLYSFVRGSGFIVALADEEGYLLRVFGDPHAESFGRLSNFVEGSNWSERVMGTNGVGTPLVTGAPIQVCGPEHYCLCAHNATCSGAPVFGPDGNIIGALDMTGENAKVHLHTLGMVVAAADAISNELRIRRLDQHKEIIMESMSEGLMVTDSTGIITHINTAAEKILRLKRRRVIGRNIEDIIKEANPDPEANLRILKMVKQAREVTDEIIEIKTQKDIIGCTITFRPLMTPSGSLAGTVMVISEMQRAKRLVNKVAGITARYTFDDLIGRDEAFLEAINLAKTSARSDGAVLLTGESGTGKDVVAQAIHNESSRRLNPFVAINCGAIPRDLLISELFGYEEGAFTGARRGGGMGKFELADGGTIFLDEIGEMSLEMQVALLRVIEEKAVTRIGGNRAIPVDVRIIAATNRDLEREVALGRFRADLFYRLNVFRINLPPLRERKGDVELLAEYFASRVASRNGLESVRIDQEALQCLKSYSWPGNVRQLQNVIERAVHLSKGGDISLRCLPEEIFGHKRSRVCQQPQVLARPLKDLEMEAIRIALEECRGNRTLAAKRLGIDRSTLYRKLARHR